MPRTGDQIENRSGGGGDQWLRQLAMKKQLNRSEMAGGVIQMRAGGEEEKVGREEQGGY